MIEEKSPIRIIALKLFADSVGDLVSVRAKITPFEKSLIEGTYELLWLDMFDSTARTSWERTLRAAFAILDSGALREPQLIWESYAEVINQVVPALQKSFERRREAKKKQSDDEIIEACLSSYKSIYEGLLPVVLAPVVYAFGLVNDPQEKAFLQRQDGRISLVVIKKMERWIRPPQNRLAIGLNNHIRNAYSHENYRILDNGRVVMYDVDPRTGKMIWGPETWTNQQLSDLCDQAWVNALAVICSLALYGLNNRQVATARGWGIPAASPSLRDRDLNRTLEGFADEASFDLKERLRSGREFILKIATRRKGIDQDEKVTMGGEGWARGFRIRVKYIKLKIVEQVVRFLQHATQYLDETQTIQIAVSTSSGEQVGELRVKKEVIENLPGPQTQDINEVRKLFEIDTLGESTMYVRTEMPPIEI